MALAASVKMEIDGQKVPDFLNFNIKQRMHGLSEFEVKCRMDTFEGPDSSLMEKSKSFIGATIKIEIESLKPGGDESLPGLFFKGIIHSVRAVKSDLSFEDAIILKGSSPEYMLSDYPGCKSFENQTLQQIVDAVLKPCPADVLGRSINPRNKEFFQYIVQHNESSLEFLQRLARRYGEWLYYNGKSLIFGEQKDAGLEEMALGKDLLTLDFSISLKAPSFTYGTYDYMSVKTVITNADAGSGKSQQNDVGLSAFNQSQSLFTTQPMNYYPHLNVESNKYAQAQKNAADAKVSAIGLSMAGIEASGENFKLIPGLKIKVTAPNSKYTGTVDYGEYMITEVEHSCDHMMNYQNRFTAVPSQGTVPTYTDPAAVPQSGPQNAVVKDNNDPEKLGRVRVNFFWQESNQMSPWIRVANPYAGPDTGFYFIPEIDDEVLVGFEDSDAEKPFVMGSLYHGKNKPLNDWPNNKNNFKGIHLKSKMKIEFDDDKKQITIETPAGNKAVISEDTKSILLEDQNKNKVEMSPSGITLDSPKDISITSKAKITIDAAAGIDITSNGSAKVEGTTIDLNAKAAFKAQGSATAEISSGGNTTVKGAMVMIN